MGEKSNGTVASDFSVTVFLLIYLSLFFSPLTWTIHSHAILHVPVYWWDARVEGAASPCLCSDYGDFFFFLSYYFAPLLDFSVLLLFFFLPREESERAAEASWSKLELLFSCQNCEPLSACRYDRCVRHGHVMPVPSYTQNYTHHIWQLPSAACCNHFIAVFCTEPPNKPTIQANGELLNSVHQCFPHHWLVFATSTHDPTNFQALFWLKRGNGCRETT